MSKKQSDASSVGGGVLGRALSKISDFLTILFCALRACGVIDWSWFWVMSPTFFSWVLVFVCFGIAGFIDTIAPRDD